MKRDLQAVLPKVGYLPAPLRASDAVAIQALAAGTANEEQQKHALDWILHSACGLREWAYREGQRDTDIALGRHFAGQHIVSAMKANVTQLRKREETKNAA